MKKLKIKDEMKKDLERLDAPLIDGMYNLCYGDGYYLKSLQSKYGMSISEMREFVKTKELQFRLEGIVVGGKTFLSFQNLMDYLEALRPHLKEESSRETIRDLEAQLNKFFKEKE